MTPQTTVGKGKEEAKRENTTMQNTTRTELISRTSLSEVRVGTVTRSAASIAAQSARRGSKKMSLTARET